MIIIKFWEDVKANPSTNGVDRDKGDRSKWYGNAIFPENPLGRRGLMGRESVPQNTPKEVLNGVGLVDNLIFKLKLKWVNVNQSFTKKVF